MRPLLNPLSSSISNVAYGFVWCNIASTDQYKSHVSARTRNPINPVVTGDFP
jgi:hypothetical protein